MSRDGADQISISLIPYGGGVNTASIYPTKLVEDPGWKGCWALPVSELQKSTPDVLNWDQWMFRSSKRHCPDFDTQIIPHSKDKAAMIAAVNGWDTFYATGTDIGTAWGLWLLSPDIRLLPDGYLPDEDEHPVDLGTEFPDRPVQFNTDQFNKVMIIMSDGNITWAPNKDGQNNLYNRGQARDNFLHLCDEAKAKGIAVHTVYFGNKSNEDMKTCSGEENYHEADEGDLSDIFLEISIGEIDVVLTH